MNTSLALRGRQQFITPNLGAFRIPASWILIWEIPFWLILAFGSLVPATLVSRSEWFGVPMKASDAVMIVSAALYGAAGLLRFAVKRSVGGASGIVAATVVLFGYGALRLVSGSLDTEDQLAMGFALMLAASGPIQASGILSLYNPRQTTAFLDRLVFFLAAVSLIYAAESVLGLGLRSEAGVILNSDFGIQRVRGPLYGSSTGYHLLIPAIGWSIGLFFRGQGSKVFASFCTISLLTAYLGLGSRAGLILLVLFMAANFVMLYRLKQSEATPFLLAGFCVCAGFLIYAQADTQRLTQFEDTHRRLTHETAANIIASEPIQSILFGQGYGAIWPWYRRDSLRGDQIAIGDNTVQTGFGSSLYHPHSTFLELGIEFGVIGIGWLSYCLYRAGRLPFARLASTGWRVFTLAVLVSFCSFGFDLFIFKEVRVNAVWWMFFIASFQLPRNPESSEL